MTIKNYLKKILTSEYWILLHFCKKIIIHLILNRKGYELML